MTRTATATVRYHNRQGRMQSAQYRVVWSERYNFKGQIGEEQHSREYLSLAAAKAEVTRLSALSSNLVSMVVPGSVVLVSM